MSVPALPQLDRALLQRHQTAHQQLAESYRRAPADVVLLFQLQQRRLVVESLAYLQPVIAAPHQQRLAVPPRSFLTIVQERRLTGAQAALRHIDSREAMRRQGLIPFAVQPTTPVVLHALLESAAPSPHNETNPGMLRVTPTAWRPEATSFEHPHWEDVEDLVQAAIQMASQADAPACARAAWMTFTMLSIHPFVDGNGRTSRALYMAIAAHDLELGIDWGVLEQWSMYRDAYVRHLQAGQTGDHYDPSVMSAAPFMHFATESSIVGANICRERIEMFAAQFDAAAQGFSGSRSHASIELLVQLLGIATLADLGELGLPDHDVDVCVHQLLEVDKLRWVQRPFSRRTFNRPEPYGLRSTRAY